MNTGLNGLPRWVLAELATGIMPEVSAQSDTVRWVRGELEGSIVYVFYVDGETYTVGWLKSRDPEPD